MYMGNVFSDMRCRVSRVVFTWEAQLGFAVVLVVLAGSAKLFGGPQSILR